MGVVLQLRKKRGRDGAEDGVLPNADTRQDAKSFGAERLTLEEIMAGAERACEEVFSRIASSMTPAALAWAEAANPEALAAYREAERRAMSFPTPGTPEELAGLKAALAELEAAWEKARSGYPVLRVLANPKARRITVCLAGPVEPQVMERFTTRLKAAMKVEAEIAFRVGAPEEGRGIPARELRAALDLEVPPERPPVRIGDVASFQGLEGRISALEPDPWGVLEGQAVRIEFPGRRPLWVLTDQLVPAGPGRWRLDAPPEVLVRAESEGSAAAEDSAKIASESGARREMTKPLPRQASGGAAQLTLPLAEPEPAAAFRSPWEDWLDGAEIVRVPGLPEWREALAAAHAAGVCGLDTETTGLDPLQNRLRLVQVAVPVYPEAHRLVATDWRNPEPGGGCRVYVLDLWTLPEPERRETLEALAHLMEDSGVLKLGHNLKFDIAFLRAALGGRRLAVERLFDTMLASQLITAGDFVPGGRWEGWCWERGLRPAKNERGQELKTRLFDVHGHLVEFEHDNQKEIKPFYPTHSLQQVAHRHLEVWLGKEFQASDWAAPELSDEQVRYAARDAAVLLPLYEILAKALNLNGLHKTAVLEFACLPAAAEVELAGMPFDAGRAREILKRTEAEAVRRKEALASLAEAIGFRPRPKKAAKGRKAPAGFNPDSAPDLAECLRLLAEREGLLAEGKLAAGGEEFDLSTQDETLARLTVRLPEGSLVRRFAEELRAYRAAKKRADFLKKWLELLHPATDRLHPDLRQINPYGVGRFSASNPNLQQVARGSDIRSLFHAPAGRKLAVADYSGIEMRIMAQLSKDANLLAAFREGADVHRRTAAAVAGKPEDGVSKEERQAAKACGFGLIYGMTGETLRRYAETSYGVRLTSEEAERMREAFFGVYPGVEEWQRRQDSCGYPKEGVETYAYWVHDFKRGFRKEFRPCTRTLGGRLRVWPAVERERRDGSGTYMRKAGAFTELYNTPDQGTGADILKAAMTDLYRELLRRGWEDVKLIATVHDELVLEAPEDLAGEAAGVLKAVMEAAGARFLPDVPVEVEAAVCESWAEK